MISRLDTSRNVFGKTKIVIGNFSETKIFLKNGRVRPGTLINANLFFGDDN